ncbi:MAG: hypothetical protein IPO87_03780 [Flavobacteriales bacterium]|nr:hypothetical protein [Flavobacteriales bacterium]
MGLSKSIPNHLSNRLPEWSILAVFIGMAFIFWKTDFNFFWRDDWNFLDSMRHFSLAYMFENHVGHVTPLFKLTYYLQLKVFGTNTIFFSYTNILFFGLYNYVIFRLARSIMSTTSAWVVAIALTIHPLMFNHVSWTFEQCITFHFLFQVLAVAYFMRWTRTGVQKELVLSFLFTIIQNYYFGNGLFIPLLFTAGVLLFRKERIQWGAFVGSLVLFLLFAIIQLILGGTRGTSAVTLTSVPDMIHYGFYFLGLSTSRIFILREWALGPITPWLTGGAFIGLALIALLRKERDRRLAWFHIIWFVLAFCSIPIVKQGTLAENTLPHYYSVLALIPMVFIIEHAVGGLSFWSRIPKRAMTLASIGLVAVVFLIDQQLKDTVSFRNFRNRQQMAKAILEGTPYIGFDDPYFTPDNYDVEDPVGIYTEWRSQDLFQLSMGYAHLLQNWTENAIGPKEVDVIVPEKELVQ